MPDAIAVLNAGSSSIKFSLFELRGPDLELTLRGQIEGIIRAGKSVASTMGFTAVEGLPMGTRCGSVDPGVLLYLMDQRGMDARTLEKLIYNQSGLLGVSGISSAAASRVSAWVVPTNQELMIARQTRALLCA